MNRWEYVKRLGEISRGQIAKTQRSFIKIVGRIEKMQKELDKQEQGTLLELRNKTLSTRINSIEIQLRDLNQYIAEFNLLV